MPETVLRQTTFSSGNVFARLYTEGREHTVVITDCAIDDLGEVEHDQTRTEAQTELIVDANRQRITELALAKLRAGEIEDGTIYLRSGDFFP